VDHVDFGLLLLRVAFGLMMVSHGYNKFFGPNGLQGTARWFESMGVRPGRLNAALAATTEVGAGLLFAAGLLTPLAAAGIIGVMVVAIVVETSAHLSTPPPEPSATAWRAPVYRDRARAGA